MGSLITGVKVGSQLGSTGIEVVLDWASDAVARVAFGDSLRGGLVMGSVAAEGVLAGGGPLCHSGGPVGLLTLQRTAWWL